MFTPLPRTAETDEALKKYEGRDPHSAPPADWTWDQIRLALIDELHSPCTVRTCGLKYTALAMMDSNYPNDPEDSRR